VLKVKHALPTSAPGAFGPRASIDIALALLFLGIGSNGIFKDGRIVHGKQAKVGLGKDKSPAWI